MTKITVLGAGAWGTTIASYLAAKGFETSIWAFEEKVVFNINGARENSIYLPGIKLSKNLKAVKDAKDALEKADLIIVAIPSKFLRTTLSNMAQLFNKKTPVLSVVKGIEHGTFKMPSQIISELTQSANIAALSGPNLSLEIAKGLPAASTVACKNISVAKKIQDVFSGADFRIYTSSDIVGVETGGAMKNVVALATGISDGMGLGNNAKSALIVRGLYEITRLGLALGAEQETFFGLSGIGDLITTSAGSLSRNHTVGREIAKGKKIKDILANMKAIPEGVDTAKSAYELSQKLKVEMPITNEVHAVLFEDKDPKTAVSSLMSRPFKNEAV